MHMRIVTYGLIILLVAATSCGVQHRLPPGERLYRGATIHVDKGPGVKTKKKQLKNTLKLAANPRPNKYILGQPIKVWWWYFIGPPDPEKENKGLKAFLRKKLAEPPVLSSRVNPKVSAENMAGLMENLGYFHTTATGDTTNSRRYTKAIYHVQVQPQYLIKSITWVSDSSALLKLLQREQERRSILKVGNPYRLSDISAERDRLDLYVKTKGYYYFNPDYILTYVDSTIGNHEVDLFLNIKRSAPAYAKHPYKINSITIFPNYSLTSESLDTSRVGGIMYDSLFIKDSGKVFNNRMFAQTVTYRPGRTYSSRSQNSTLNRFISLGSFKFVKNRFERSQTDTLNHLLNAYYYLTPARKKSIQFEIDGFYKENNSLGSQVSLNWRNRNAFKGSELFTVKAYTGFEVSYFDSLKNNNSFRVGAEGRIKFPRYAIPFLRIKENNFYTPNTSLSLGYELLRRQLFYTKHLFKLQYEFTWKNNVRNQFTFAPFSLSYLNASNVEDTVYKQALVDPSILLNIYSEAILGSYFSYSYNSGRGSQKNKFYFNGAIDVSGNLAGLITGAKNLREKTIFNTPFAQYIKTDLEVQFTRRLSSKTNWANRLQLGIGIPYNNSALLPFAKQYIIGGGSSVRGFRIRNVGPGTYKPTIEDLRFFQVIGGDYKFLFNSEWRIAFTRVVNGAVFADIGNIWTKDTLLFGKAGQLSRNWYKELAIASGIGLRFDFTFILLRVDLGIPLRKPYLPSGQRWVIKNIDFGSAAWRKENLILNIAIGYPF